MAQVVEHDAARRRPSAPCPACRCRPGSARRRRLDGAHEVVAEQPDRAAGERRQARRAARSGSGASSSATARVRVAACVAAAIEPDHARAGGSRGTSSARRAGPARPTRAGTTGPPPRSFRNAETGVSQSSMKVWRSGMSVVLARQLARLVERRASARGQPRRRSFSTSLGVRQRPARARPAARPGGRARRRPPRPRARRTPRAPRARPPRPPPGPSRRSARGRASSSAGVAAVGRSPRALGERALERRQRLARAPARARRCGSRCARRCGRPGRRARPARAARRRRSRSAAPGAAGRCPRSRPCATARSRERRPEAHLAGLARALERLVVHVGERQHLAGAPVLDYAGQKVHPAKYCHAPSTAGNRQLQELVGGADLVEAEAVVELLGPVRGVGDHEHLLAARSRSPRRRPRPPPPGRGRDRGAPRACRPRPPGRARRACRGGMRRPGRRAARRSRARASTRV